ncbi:hypothetical protein AN191_13885 [Loktanella sp. 5RATIMAR09]|nr:hypothetical protein AN191_13885 [Loktanella sp. 5RATIMAR09]
MTWINLQRGDGCQVSIYFVGSRAALVVVVDGVDAYRHAMGEQCLAAATVEFGQGLPKVTGRLRKVARPSLLAPVEGLRIGCFARARHLRAEGRVARFDIDTAVEPSVSDAARCSNDRELRKADFSDVLIGSRRLVV